jgi:hypothetical protein
LQGLTSFPRDSEICRSTNSQNTSSCRASKSLSFTAQVRSRRYFLVRLSLQPLRPPADTSVNDDFSYFLHYRFPIHSIHSARDGSSWMSSRSASSCRRSAHFAHQSLQRSPTVSCSAFSNTNQSFIVRCLQSLLATFHNGSLSAVYFRFVICVFLAPITSDVLARLPRILTHLNEAILSDPP